MSTTTNPGRQRRGVTGAPTDLPTQPPTAGGGPRGWWGRFQQWRNPSRLGVGVIGGLVTLVCSLALLPIAAGGWWLNRSLVVIAAIVISGAVMRAVRVPLPLLPVGATMVLLCTLCAVFVPEAAFAHFVPTPAALEGLRELLESGRSDAWATVPPAGQTPGLLLIVVAAIGLVALMVDTLAAGLDLPSLTLVPLAGLYAAPWLVGAGFPPTGSLVLVLGGWLVLLATHERSRVRAAIPSAVPGPALPGVLAVVMCMVAAVAVTDWLPTTGDGKRISGMRPIGLSVDPVVSLRRAVITATGETVLTYMTSTDRPDYLRLAILDRFDGQEWSVSDEPVTGSGTQAPNGEWSRYALDIGPLLGQVIPSPTGTATVQTDSAVVTSPTGLPMRVGSAVTDTSADLRVRAPVWTAAALAAAATDPVAAPSGMAVDPTPLVGPKVGELAREVTAGSQNSFEAAMALQRWFTDRGNFRYSTDAADDTADINRFLTDRVGYCEQFAASMAAMARTLGIPARVAVGFTAGRLTDGVWTVADSDAHAWPELWLGSAGWVRFEPTPRTDAISVPPYARPDIPQASSTQEPEPSASTSVAPSDPQDNPEGTAAAPLTSQSSSSPAVWAAVLLLGGLALVPAGLRRWRRRRTRRSGTPQAAYREVLDTWIDLYGGRPGTTERQTLELVCAGLPAPAQQVAGSLADAVERERYGPPVPAVVAAGGSAAQVDLLADAMRAAAGRGARLRATLLPRSLWR